MRAKEFITETSVTPLTNDVARELPGVYTIGALPNSDFYKQYRFGVAMAGAKGARVRAEQDDKIAPYASAPPSPCHGPNILGRGFEPS